MAATQEPAEESKAVSPQQLPKTMKAAILHKNGDPTTSDILSVVNDVPVPTPSEGQLLVRVHAAAINPVDWILCKGDCPGLKCGTVGGDVCGTVVAINGDEISLKEGDIIYAGALRTMGSFAEYMVVDAHVASKKPVNVTDAEAASLPLAGLTALQGLIHGGIKAGQKVLILGGTGGVGSLAIQMAKALGASHVTATGSNVNLIRDTLGADEAIDYTTESLMEALAGKEFDLVFDTIGGLEHWTVGRAALKHDGGVFVTIVGDGDSNLRWRLVKANWRMLVAKVLGGPEYRNFFADINYNGVTKDLATITEMVESGKVKPLLDERQFQLTTAGIHDMIKASMSRRAKGKLILQVLED